jgi:hypothetical protein
MSEFDPEKALREEIQGLSDVLKTITVQVNHAERKAGEEQDHLDSMLKLQAFTKGEVARKMNVLRALQEQKVK